MQKTILLLLLFALLCPCLLQGQAGVIFQRVYPDSLRQLHPQTITRGYASAEFNTIAAHPNGGIVATGKSDREMVFTRSFSGAIQTHKSNILYRISSSGDSLGRYRLPAWSGYNRIFATGAECIARMGVYFIAFSIDDTSRTHHPTWISIIDSSGRPDISLSSDNLTGWGDFVMLKAMMVSSTDFLLVGIRPSAGGLHMLRYRLPSMQLVQNVVSRYLVESDNLPMLLKNGQMMFLYVDPANPYPGTKICVVDSAFRVLRTNIVFTQDNAHNGIRYMMPRPDGKIVEVITMDTLPFPRTTQLTKLRVIDTIRVGYYVRLTRTLPLNFPVADLQIIATMADTSLLVTYPTYYDSAGVHVRTQQMELWGANLQTKRKWILSRILNSSLGPGIGSVTVKATAYQPSAVPGQMGTAYVGGFADYFPDSGRMNTFYLARLSDFPAFYNPAALHNTLGPRESLLLLTAYPNPTQGQITVEALKDGEAQLFSLSGKLLGSYATRRGRSISIDLSAYPSGMYLLRQGARVGRVVRE